MSANVYPRTQISIGEISLSGLLGTFCRSRSAANKEHAPCNPAPPTHPFKTKAELRSGEKAQRLAAATDSSAGTAEAALLFNHFIGVGEAGSPETGFCNTESANLWPTAH